MEKTLIVYFTKTGNNKFVAEKLSKLIDADLDVITPKSKTFFLLIISTWLKIGTGIIPLSSNLKNYERVILFSPIWMGNLISPIRGFVKRYKGDIKKLVFITVCGGGEEDKDTGFGYEGVFKEMRKLFSEKQIDCYEISTKNLESDEKTEGGEAIISEEVFKGDIKDRLDEIVRILRRN